MKSNPSLQRNSRLLILPILAALVLAASSVGSRSAKADDEVVWRPVDPSDLALKAPIVEPDADAEAIFWDIRIDDRDGDLVLSHYVRIKIFTDRGREKQSSIDISFLNGTKVKDVAARTIKPDGTIIEVAKTDVLERTVVKVSGLKIQTKSFAFPGIEVGSIIEYRWKEVISHATADNMHIQFQREIPVQSITYHIKPPDSSTSFDLRAYHMEAPEFQKEKNGFQFITVTKMPAFHEEPMMPPDDSVRKWAIVKYHNLFSILFSNYEFLASRLYNTYQPYLKVDDDIKRKSEEVVAGATTSEQKLQKIYDFCRATIKNTDFKISGFTAEEMRKLKESKKSADTLKRGVGPGIDVNLLFGALANAAGFEAYIALTPDRGRSFFDKNMVVYGAIRPSSVAVRDGDTWKFFDPGYHYVTAGMLRWQEEGVEALIAKQSPRWIKTPMTPHDKSRETRTATMRLDENGTLEGDVTIEYTGHLAVEKKVINDDDSPNQREETLKETMKNRQATAELTNIVIENVTDSAKPFIYRYHVRVPEYAQKVGKRLFLQPAFFQKGIPVLFSTSYRRHPIYFHFPWSEEDKVTIVLPKGYAVDTADTPAPFGAGAVCRYEAKMGVTKDQSTLVFNRSFFFGGNETLLFPAETYGQMKKLFDDLNKRDNHTITLKQSGPAS